MLRHINITVLKAAEHAGYTHLQIYFYYESKQKFTNWSFYKVLENRLTVLKHKTDSITNNNIHVF